MNNNNNNGQAHVLCTLKMREGDVRLCVVFEI